MMKMSKQREATTMSNLIRTFSLMFNASLVPILVMLLPSSGSGFQMNHPPTKGSSIIKTRITSSSKSISMPTTTTLFGISEWRDIWFDYPGTGDDRRLGIESEDTPPKEICILPFPYTEVLLQGETKQLRLYEDRFIELFDYAMEHHEGVVAMGLLADSGIIQTVPICEIEAYNRMDGFGIFVTIRVVGRAQLAEITQQAPYLKAVCKELSDTLPPNLELPCLVASNIENAMLTLSSMEYTLDQAKLKKNSDDGDSIVGRGSNTTDASSEEDAEMNRRIQIAKLVRLLYENTLLGNTVLSEMAEVVCDLTPFLFLTLSIYKNLWFSYCFPIRCISNGDKMKCRRIGIMMILVKMMMTTMRMATMTILNWIVVVDIDNHTMLQCKPIHKGIVYLVIVEVVHMNAHHKN